MFPANPNYLQRSPLDEHKASNPLFCPIRQKNIGIPGAAIIPVAAEDQLLSIGTEHGEGIKTIIMTDLFQVGPIFIDSI